MNSLSQALELFGALVVFLVGLAFLAAGLALYQRHRAFVANAHPTRLRVDHVEARPSGRKQAGRSVTYIPHFEVLDGPHSGTIAPPSGMSGRWRGTEGKTYEGWFDPRSQQATSRGDLIMTTLLLPIVVLLGFGLVWYGFAIIAEEFR
ncbi:MAG: hypothetical protein AAFO73_03665 [Pseudomonadota bacterium]